MTFPLKIPFSKGEPFIQRSAPARYENAAEIGLMNLALGHNGTREYLITKVATGSAGCPYSTPIGFAGGIITIGTIKVCNTCVRVEK